MKERTIKTVGSGRQDALLSPMDAMRRLRLKGRTPHTVLRLIREGKLDAIKLNARVIRIRESEVERFLADSGTTAATDPR